MKGTRREWLALVALCGLANMGFAAQPMAPTQGITVTVQEIRQRGERLFFRTNFINQNPSPIVINRDLIQIVLPDGRRLGRSSGRMEIRGSYVVPTGQSHAVNFDFQSNGAFNWSQWSPLTIEWGTAVTVNNQPIALPPLVVTP